MRFLLHNLLCVVTVIGPSMQPTLQTGDRILILRRGFKNKLKLGQIVVVAPQGIPPKSKLAINEVLFSGNAYIKRITALGGQVQYIPENELINEDLLEAQTVSMRGGIYIKPENRTYLPPLTAPLRTSDGGYKYSIPEGHCFILSDNRAFKSDSRIFGPIPMEAILGVAIAKLP